MAHSNFRDWSLRKTLPRSVRELKKYLRGKLCMLLCQHVCLKAKNCLKARLNSGFFLPNLFSHSVFASFQIMKVFFLFHFFFIFSLFPCSAPIETVRFLLLLPSQITHMLILSHSLLHLNPSFFQPQCILFIHPYLSLSLSMTSLTTEQKLESFCSLNRNERFLSSLFFAA